MIYSRVSQESQIPATGSGRAGIETVEAPFKSKETPENAAGKADPQPSIQPVSERFPALEEQEVVLTFSAPEAWLQRALFQLAVRSALLFLAARSAWLWRGVFQRTR